MSDTTSVSVVPSPELVSFAEREATRVVVLDNSLLATRSTRRVPLSATVVAQSVDHDLRPIGDPFAAVTRDYSRRGLSLIVENWPRCKLLAVQLTVAENQYCLLVKEKWRRPMAPFTYVGLRILRQLEGPRWSAPDE